MYPLKGTADFSDTQTFESSLDVRDEAGRSLNAPIIHTLC